MFALLPLSAESRAVFLSSFGFLFYYIDQQVAGILRFSTPSREPLSTPLETKLNT